MRYFGSNYNVLLTMKDMAMSRNMVNETGYHFGASICHGGSEHSFIAQ